MSIFPEPGRQAAHVLIDGASASLDYPRDGSDAANLAYQRLLQIEGGIVVKVDDPGPDEELDVQLDLSNLLGATLITIRRLAERLAEAEGRDVESVLVELREFVDA